MTPTHTESPIRRSNMSTFKTPAQTPIINDDEEERRQARRRTYLDESTSTSGSRIEENQTLKDCLKIFTDNKLSKENAWSVSLIDTLSNLLDKHHKSLNNFKVAGSSLEASSKVYGLRVDSVHTDVVRMSAGMYKQKDRHEPANDINEDGNDNVNENVPNETTEGGHLEGENQSQPKPKKRKRKQVSTVTRNEDTINGHLDTHPCTDPIFAKLNSIVGSINSSNRLLQNILPTTDSELRLRMTYNFWDSSDSKGLEFDEEYNYDDVKMAEMGPLEDIKIADSVLRPDQSGYIILDTPADPDDEELPPFNLNDSDKMEQSSNNAMALAFDMNADVEPEPLDTHTFVDVDIDQFDELTHEEQIAINKCRGLRRAPVIIEDMRPIDSTSNLEYSYRPLDKISQFWAGPSHWKFKKSRKTSLSMVQRLTQSVGGLQNNRQTQNLQNQRQRKKLSRSQPKHVLFGETHDDLFQKLDSKKTKLKKVNIQKKWDAKKLKLPTDLQIDEECFDVYDYAPAVRVQEMEDPTSPDLPLESYDYNNQNDQQYCSNIQNDDDYADDGNDADNHHISNHETNPEIANVSNTTIMEISTDFEGAPDKVIKVVVPFAKRAKVIDMKQLKYCCMNLIKKDFSETEKENIPSPVNYPKEQYKAGAAKFKSIYTKLPNMLTTNMAEALSTTVAFYSILHLANDNNLRLVQQDDLNDFQIRQLNI